MIRCSHKFVYDTSEDLQFPVINFYRLLRDNSVRTNIMLLLLSKVQELVIINGSGSRNKKITELLYLKLS